MIYLRSVTPSCTNLPRLQRASPPRSAPRNCVCCVCRPCTARCRGGLHGRPSLLHVSISILLPVVWQKCTPAHRTGVWAAAPRLEPSGPHNAVHAINIVGRGALSGPYCWSCNTRCLALGVLSGVRCCFTSFLRRLIIAKTSYLRASRTQDRYYLSNAALASNTFRTKQPHRTLLFS